MSNKDTTVLMFGWEFPPFNSGGLGTACLGLTKALSHSGTNVLFVLPKKVGVSSNYMKMLFADNSNVKFKNVDTLLYPYLTSEEYEQGQADKNGNFGRTLFEEVKRYSIRAREIAKREKFDVIHAHDWLAFPAGVEAKKASGKPLVLHVHATEFDRTAGHGANDLVYSIEKNAMEIADKIIAVSNFTKEKIIKHYGIDPNKIEIVHNGVDVEDWRTDHITQGLEGIKRDGSKVAIYVGRITIQKGPEYFLYAAQKVLERNPETYFVVSGSGDMEHKMLNLAVNLGISDRVLFTGFLRGDDLKALYKSADLFVMPSVSEPFGLTPLEAMSANTPVIVSKQAGVSEVLTHALKVDFWDTDEMANKMLGVLSHDSLIQTLQENGRSEVEHISWEKAADKCVEIYHSLIGQKHYKIT